MMSDVSTTSDSGSVPPGVGPRPGGFDLTLCGQCNLCRAFFPCEQLFALQIWDHEVYQETGRLICFECQRSMNPRAYRTRELGRHEVEAALREWLIQRRLLPQPPLPS